MRVCRLCDELIEDDPHACPRPRDRERIRALIEAAAQASETHGDDELERFARDVWADRKTKGRR